MDKCRVADCQPKRNSQPLFITAMQHFTLLTNVIETVAYLTMF